MAEKEAAERFWTFALALYGQDAAREALLRLQDRDGADVPMMLWCVWRGVEGFSISGDVMTEAVGFSTAWREGTVAPLRKIRKALKSGISGVEVAMSEAARSRVAETEQAVERMQMDQLAGMSGDHPHGDPRQNLERYALVGGLSLNAEDVSVVMGMC